MSDFRNWFQVHSKQLRNQTASDLEETGAALR